MRDYKHFSRDLEDLHREIEKTIDDIQRIRNRTDRKKFSVGLIFPVIGIIGILFAGVLGLRGTVFSSDTVSEIPAVSSDYSLLGKQLIHQELKQLENPYASGGVEINASKKNDPDLKFFFYKVRQGESVYSISRKLGLRMDTLISLNTMDNAHSIHVGDKILVPNRQGILYSVKKKDSLGKIAKAYHIKVDSIIDANEMMTNIIHPGNILFLPGARLSARERAKALGYVFMKPLHGRFTSPFGIRTDPFTGRKRFHSGVDIAAPRGTRVHAAKEGKVIYAAWRGGYGNCIIIKHQFGYETVYGHLSRIYVSKGSYVRGGQVIGAVGSTGRSTGPHLHLEVRKFGRPINPFGVQGLKKAKGSRWY